jgi:hypothetical protein
MKGSPVRVRASALSICRDFHAKPASFRAPLVAGLIGQADG